MALDRSWFNTLVDDDGSGLTGSIWDKADVDALMDAVDAEFARLISTNIWTPTIGTLGGGTPTYAYQSALWAKAGTLVFISGRVALTSKGSLPASPLVFGGLPFTSSSWTQQGGIMCPVFSGVSQPVASLSAYFPANAAYAPIMYGVPTGSGTAPNLYATQITDAFDVTFAGTFKVD